MKIARNKQIDHGNQCAARKWFFLSERKNVKIVEHHEIESFKLIIFCEFKLQQDSFCIPGKFFLFPFNCLPYLITFFIWNTFCDTIRLILNLKVRWKKIFFIKFIAISLTFSQRS